MLCDEYNSSKTLPKDRSTKSVNGPQHLVHEYNYVRRYQKLVCPLRRISGKFPIIQSYKQSGWLQESVHVSKFDRCGMRFRRFPSDRAVTSECPAFAHVETSRLPYTTEMARRQYDRRAYLVPCDAD